MLCKDVVAWAARLPRSCGMQSSRLSAISHSSVPPLRSHFPRDDPYPVIRNPFPSFSSLRNSSPDTPMPSSFLAFWPFFAQEKSLWHSSSFVSFVVR